MIPITHEDQTYSLLVDQHEDGYLGYFPALPGCYSWGPTYAAAVDGAGEALDVHLRSLPDADKAVPDTVSQAPVSLSARVLAFAPFLRRVRRNEIAAAAAMATCIAIILNVGPFTQNMKINALPPETVAATPRPSDESEWSLRPSLAERDAAPVSEPAVGTRFNSVKVSVEPASVSVVGITTAKPIPLDRPNEGNELPSDQASQNPEPNLALQAHAPNSDPDLIKQTTMVGIWSPEGGACSAQDFQQGVLPAVISSDGAWAGDTYCIFRKKQQTQTGWNLVAECSNPREHWTSNVRLKVNDGRLIWTSKRGAQAYVRCAPNVLMAQAK